MTTIGSTATGVVVRGSLTTRRPDVAGTVFYIALLLSLVFSLAILAILMLEVLARALPVFQERGMSFFTSQLSADPSKAGLVQGLMGTMLITLLVQLFCFSICIVTVVYFENC